jgi:anti-sigma factor RsiW
MKPITETDLVDYLGGELSAEEAGRVEAAVADDSALRAELEELRELMAEIKSAEEPTLSAAADARFETMLAAALTEQGQATEMTTIRSLPPRKRYFRLLAAAAAILLIFAAGWYVGGAEDRATARQLAATRTLMLDLMKDSRPSARIQATTFPPRTRRRLPTSATCSALTKVPTYGWRPLMPSVAFRMSPLCGRYCSPP